MSITDKRKQSNLLMCMKSQERCGTRFALIRLVERRRAHHQSMCLFTLITTKRQCLAVLNQGLEDANFLGESPGPKCGEPSFCHNSCAEWNVTRVTYPREMMQSRCFMKSGNAWVGFEPPPPSADPCILHLGVLDINPPFLEQFSIKHKNGCSV